eukprot:9550288-Alexandrium_andersonii.AAC.1
MRAPSGAGTWRRARARPFASTLATGTSTFPCARFTSLTTAARRARERLGLRLRDRRAPSSSQLPLGAELFRGVSVLAGLLARAQPSTARLYACAVLTFVFATEKLRPASNFRRNVEAVRQHGRPRRTASTFRRKLEA